MIRELMAYFGRRLCRESETTTWLVLSLENMHKKRTHYAEILFRQKGEQSSASRKLFQSISNICFPGLKTQPIKH